MITLVAGGGAGAEAKGTVAGEASVTANGVAARLRGA
jgi:hypothetical protein